MHLFSPDTDIVGP